MKISMKFAALALALAVAAPAQALEPQKTLIAEISGEISAFKAARDKVRVQIFVQAAGGSSLVFRQCTSINNGPEECQAHRQVVTLQEMFDVTYEIPNDVVRVFTDTYRDAAGESRGFLRRHGIDLVGELRTYLKGGTPQPIKAEGIYDAHKLFPYILSRI